MDLITLFIAILTCAAIWLGHLAWARSSQRDFKSQSYDEKSKWHMLPEFETTNNKKILMIVILIIIALVLIDYSNISKDNQPPYVTNLSAQIKVDGRDVEAISCEIGDTVLFSAIASDANDDAIYYRFFLRGNPVTNWTTNNTWRWTATLEDIGKNKIDVNVRDGKHAGSESFDSNASTAILVALRPRVELIDVASPLIYSSNLPNGHPKTLTLSTSNVILDKQATFRVKSGSLAISRVLISVNGENIGSTDDSGSISFTPAGTGTLEVIARKSGYVSSRESLVVITAAEASSLTKKLTIFAPSEVNKGEIFRIDVLEGIDRNPAREAKIFFDHESIGKTNDAGALSYSSGSTGVHIIKVEKAGFENATKKITVNSALKVLRLNIQNESRLGQEIKISADVKNTGTADDTGTIQLKLNGTIVESENLSLKSGESSVIYFSYKPIAPGLHIFSADDIKISTNIINIVSSMHYPLIAVIIAGLALLAFAILILPGWKCSTEVENKIIELNKSFPALGNFYYHFRMEKGASLRDIELDNAKIPYTITANLPRQIYQDDSKNIFIKLSKKHNEKDNASLDNQFMEMELRAAGLKLEGEKAQRQKLGQKELIYCWNCNFPTSGNHEINLVLRLVSQLETTQIGIIEHTLRVVKLDHLTQRQVWILSGLFAVLIGIIGAYKILVVDLKWI